MNMLVIGTGIETLRNWLSSSLGMGDVLAMYMTATLCIVGASLVTVGLMTAMWRNRKAILRDRDLKLDRFTFPALPGISLLNALRLPMPKFSFDLSGGRGIVTALGIVGVSFAVAFSFVVATTDENPVWPQPGAAYSLPNTFGTPLSPDPSDPATRSQTLQINLASGVRLDKLHLKNLDLGKAGLTNSLYVQGVTGSRVSVGLITIRNSSAPTLDWSRINTGCLTLAGNVDGHTLAATISSTIPNLVIDSDRGAGTYVAENSTVDRIIIKTNGPATIGEILIDDVDASVGAWKWEGVDAGCINLEATNTFGDGTGINVASAVFNDTVKARVITNNLVDTPVSVK